MAIFDSWCHTYPMAAPAAPKKLATCQYLLLPAHYPLSNRSINLLPLALTHSHYKHNNLLLHNLVNQAIPTAT